MLYWQFGCQSKINAMEGDELELFKSIQIAVQQNDAARVRSILNSMGTLLARREREPRQSGTESMDVDASSDTDDQSHASYDSNCLVYEFGGLSATECENKYDNTIDNNVDQITSDEALRQLRHEHFSFTISIVDNRTVSDRIRRHVADDGTEIVEREFWDSEDDMYAWDDDSSDEENNVNHSNNEEEEESQMDHNSDEDVEDEDSEEGSVMESELDVSRTFDPLSTCVICGNVEMAQMLIDEFHANCVEQFDFDDQPLNPSYLTVKFRQPKILQLMLDYIADCDAIARSAIQWCNLDILNVLYEHGRLNVNSNRIKRQLNFHNLRSQPPEKVEMLIEWLLERDLITDTLASKLQATCLVPTLERELHVLVDRWGFLGEHVGRQWQLHMISESVLLSSFDALRWWNDFAFIKKGDLWDVITTLLRPESNDLQCGGHVLYECRAIPLSRDGIVDLASMLISRNPTVLLERTRISEAALLLSIIRFHHIDLLDVCVGLLHQLAQTQESESENQPTNKRKRVQPSRATKAQPAHATEFGYEHAQYWLDDMAHNPRLCFWAACRRGDVNSMWQWGERVKDQFPQTDGMVDELFDDNNGMGLESDGSDDSDSDEEDAGVGQGRGKKAATKKRKKKKKKKKSLVLAGMHFAEVIGIGLALGLEAGSQEAVVKFVRSIDTRWPLPDFNTPASEKIVERCRRDLLERQHWELLAVLNRLDIHAEVAFCNEKEATHLVSTKRFGMDGMRFYLSEAVTLRKWQPSFNDCLQLLTLTVERICLEFASQEYRMLMCERFLLILNFTAENHTRRVMLHLQLPYTIKFMIWHAPIDWLRQLHKYDLLYPTKDSLDDHYFDAVVRRGSVEVLEMIADEAYRRGGVEELKKILMLRDADTSLLTLKQVAERLGHEEAATWFDGLRVRVDGERSAEVEPLTL